MSSRNTGTEKNQNSHKKNQGKQQKFVHWNTRASSDSINVIYYPCTDAQRKPDNDCTCKREKHSSPPKPKVKKAPKTIKTPEPQKYKTTTSKYHTNCLPSTSKPKIIRTPPPKPQIVSNSVHREYLGPNKDYKQNICYCHLPNISPLLPCKPPATKSSCKKGVKNRHKLTDEYFPRHTLDTLRKARDLLDYEPESEFLKRIRKEAKETFDCQCAKCRLEEEAQKFKFTPNRQLLEKHYEETKKYNLNEIFRDHKRNKKTQITYSDCKYNLNPEIDKEFEEYKHRLIHENDQIHTIRHIRDENYFDTHSTDHFDRQPVSPHICIHKFALDKRLLPNPINSDHYGFSCCAICDKPMDNVLPGNNNVTLNTENEHAKREKNMSKLKMKHFKPEIKKYPTKIKKINSDVKKSTPRIRNSIPEFENRELEIELYKPRSQNSDSSSESLSEQHPLSASRNFIYEHDIITDKLKYYNRMLTSKAMEAIPRRIHIPSKTDVMVLVESPYKIPEPKIIKMKRSVVPRNSWALRFQERMM